jgi:bifunctional DNA-binding transcriptional regulator/antitoxin component of YhaV-PrlF toxin-antitoxin module
LLDIDAYLWHAVKSYQEITSVGWCMNQIVHTKMGEGRRIAIPADLCHHYHLEPGAPIVLESSESSITIRPLDTVIREVQAFFADAAPPKVVLSEELSRDRRAEAKRETRD